MTLKKKKTTSVAATITGSKTSNQATFTKKTSIIPVSLIAEFNKSLSITFTNYFNSLTPRLMLTDFFLLFLVIVALNQFIFVLLAGNFPFNAFLGGFISTVGQFVLTVSLRLQSVTENKTVFGKITSERAIGDHIFASLILHFIIYHFIN